MKVVVILYLSNGPTANQLLPGPAGCLRHFGTDLTNPGRVTASLSAISLQI